MEGIALLMLVLFLAFLVESLVEFVLGVAFDKVPVLQGHKWVLQYVALGVGIVLAFAYNLDLVAQMAAVLKLPLSVSVAGKVLTGMAIGRGSNYINDIWSKFFKSPSEGGG